MFGPRFALAVFFCVSLPIITRAATVQAGAAASIDWPSYNNDVRSDRFADIDQIDSSNVRRLHVVCSAQVGPPQTFESGPIVVGGVLYATTSNQTIALNAATCRQLWVNTYAKNPGLTNRGAAYAGGLLYRGFSDGHVIAIDAASGKTVWNQLAIAKGSLEVIDAAPIVWNTAVIIGTANGDAGQLCHVLALDQKTGRLLWSQQTVPNPGTPLAATWKGATHIAGGAAWTSFTIDSATGELYAPVGNPGPDYDSRDRLGANLYTNSVLEIDAATGTFRRGIQLLAQDDHDWDQAASPAVVTLANGTKIALVAGKDGYLRSFNLSTLAQNWQTPVTTIANATAPISTSGTHFCPSGAVLWNGPAYSPATGFAYVNASDWCRTVYLEAKPEPYVPGKEWNGSNKVTRDAERSGWLDAVDATTGRMRWTYHSTLPLIAGVTPTSGGLVFTADLLGNILAFDAVGGALLETVATGLPVGGGVISYAVSGTQYIAVAAGMTSGEFLTKAGNPSIVVLGL